MGFLFLAEADATIALPWAVWSGIGAALVSAVVWLARTYKASVERSNAEMVSLVREVVGSIAASTAAVSANTQTLSAVLEAVKDIRRA